MSNAVAKVSFLQGQAWAKAPDGTLRALTVGSVLNDDEVLVTAQGARVELDVGNDEPLVVNGGAEVGMSRDFLADTATAADEARLSDTSVQEALTVLEQGGDLLEELEETAAGNTGGGAGDGHDFVRLTRLIETTNPQAFDYSPASAAVQAPIEDDADYINRAPLVTDQVIAANEDEPVTGQIIADDIEGDVLTFTLATPPVNGALVLDPVTGQFTFTPNANYNGPDSFVVTVTDSSGNSTTTTVTLSIAPVNDVPTSINASLTTDEDTAVTGQIQVQDIEGDNLSYSVATAPVNGVVTINPATGAFVYSPNTNYNGSDSFVVTISDGNGGTTTSTVSIGVSPVNDAPIASSLNLITNEDVAISGQIVASDIDGDTLAYAISGVPTNGVVTLNPATGSFVYTPNANYNGSDSFVVTINDGKGGTTTSTVAIGVTPVNNAPTSSNQSLVTDEDVPLSGQIVATDLEGDTLAYTVSAAPANGTLTLNPATGAFVFTPNANYNGSDSFVVTVSDGNGGTTTSTVTIGVAPVNDAPTANNLSLTTDEDVAISGQVVANDIDGDALSYNLSGAAANGSVALDATTGAFVYTPNANYNGSDSFVVTVSDGNGGVTTSTVSIGVAPVNDTPVSNNQSLVTDEETPLNGQIVATDIDGDALSYSVTTSPVNGALTLNPSNGAFVFTPNANYNGSDSFVVTISDGNGGTTTSTITIGVTPVNDAPVSANQNLTTQEDTPLSGKIVANDIDGDALSYSVTTSPANGTLTLNAATGAFVFIPNTNYNGSDSFVVTISDGKGSTTTSTISITVNPVSPVLNAADDSINVNEEAFITGTVATNDQLGETPSGFTLVTGPVNGTLTFDTDGSYRYQPNANFYGIDSFTYLLTDSDGNTDTAMVTITVNSVDDAAVVSTGSGNVIEDTAPSTSGTLTATDADNASLAFIAVTQSGNYGSLVLQANGEWTYTLDARADALTAGESKSETFTVNLTDGSTTTIAVGITGTNDVAVVSTGSGDVVEDTSPSTSGTLTAVDADNASLAFIAATQSGSYGSLVLQANGEWTYTLDARADALTAGESKSETFTVDLTDGSTTTITVGITGTDDVAIVSTGSGDVVEDTKPSTSGTLTAVDADNASLAFITATQSGSYGSLVLQANGEWTYTLDARADALTAGEIKSETFTVNLTNGSTTTITVGITGTNEGPTAVADTGTTLRNTALTFTPAELLGNDTDPNGDTLTIASVQGEVNGRVELVAGNVVFVPTTGYSGPASFTYTITDSEGGSSTASVDITVVKPNTAPDAVNDSKAPSDASKVGFFSEYFGYREGTDGANLTNLQQIYSFMNGRTADATFTAKTFDYGSAFTSGNNLGNGTNLQTFLGSDAASLSADPATTTDAIIRMRGFVELSAGTYNFKVQADDGYQIAVDGVVVAQVDRNQSLTTSTHNQFTLSTSGLHHVEIIYWDQGGYARLKVELSDDAGVTYDLLSAVPNYSSSVFAAVEGTPLNIAAATLLANDTDADGDTLTITSVQGEQNGSVSLVGGNIIFTPAANYAGPASFTYTIRDGKAGSDTATVNLVVAPVNDAPIAVANSSTTATNAAVTIPVTTLLANDSDVDGNPISIVSVQGAANGAVSLSGSNVIFTPATNFEGVASFTYTIRDTAGATSTAAVNVTVGSASAPSLVVSKALLAVAHGTGGTSVKFPIITALVDTDGSESLSIKINGVPTGVSFNAGTNLGGGVWQFVPADLSNLTLNLPGSYTTLATNLTVQVTSTEINGGATASVSSVVTLKAAYTTVDITTTESGSYTGSSANEYIQGGNGNNTINAGSGNNVVNGGAGNDNLSAAAGSDVFFGGSGNDTINGGSGTDRISGGSGNDTLKGGDAGENFVDVFVWSLGDQGVAGTPAEDTIQNFATAAAGSSTNGGDVLDLRDLLQGEAVGAANGAGNLANYLHFEVSGSDTIVHISHTGGFSADSHTVGAAYTGSAETQKVFLSGVNLQSLYSGATTDQQIITQLLNNNKLITD